MRRVLSFLFLLCLLTGLAAARAAGPAGTLSVRFYDESAGCYGALTDTDRVNLTLDGTALYPLDVPALVQYPAGQNGRTLVPVRLIAESLGASVTWVPDTRQVILQKGESTIVLTLGSATALVNGQEILLPDGIPAGVVKWEGKESTMVPLRFSVYGRVSTVAGLLNATAYIGCGVLNLAAGSLLEHGGDWHALFVLWLALAWVAVAVTLVCAGLWKRFSKKA